MGTDWTVDTLKEHYDRVWHEFEKSANVVRAQDLHSLEKASQALNIRLEGMNEFRRLIENERGDYVRREYYDSQHQTLEDRTTRVEGMQLKLLGAMGLALVIIPLFTMLLTYQLTK